MLVNNTNITDKIYKKLSIQVSLNKLSYCCTDILNHNILSFKEIDFNLSGNQKPENVEEQLTKIFVENEELNEAYDEILVMHDNHLSTFVPVPLFDENFLGSYLQFNVKVFETDFFAFDEMPTYQMNDVYVPYSNINNFFVDAFKNFHSKHVNTILVTKLLDLSKNVDERKMFVHMSKNHFEIIVVQNQKLLLFNTFEYKTPDDLIYYLLFTAEQLNLNPEFFKLEFIGDISEDDNFFKIAYKYIRNVSLFDVTEMQKNNPFSKAANSKHFILFQS